jgi:Inhibitor of Apoptosis domain
VYGRILTFPIESLGYNILMVDDLAENGFRWCDDGTRLGTVQCVYCKLTFKDWDEYMRNYAGIEHHLFKSECPLVKRQFILNYAYEYPTLKAKVEKDVEHHPEIWPAVKNRVMRQATLNYTQPPHYSNLGEATMERFLMYGEMHGGDVLHYAMYGFKWMGKLDLQCEYCGIRIQGWQLDDNVAVEHLHYSPDCPYMNNFTNLNEE